MDERATISILTRTSRVGLRAAAFAWTIACGGCNAEQHFGAAESGQGGREATTAGASGSTGKASNEARAWQWLNPQMGSGTLRAVWANTKDDVWFVGDTGNIIHWDGKRASRPYAGALNESFYSVWSSGPNDVWIAGDHGPETSSFAVHWDGERWVPNVRFAQPAIHSIWGLDASLVFAVTAGGGGTFPVLYVYDGEDWSPIFPICEQENGEIEATGMAPDSPCWSTQQPLREVWGVDRENLWVVGDGGALWSFSAEDPEHFVRRPADEESPLDPYDASLNYVGIWGSAADEVWALSAPMEHDEEKRLALAHWDGQTWSAEWLSNSASILSLTVKPTRRGHILWGGSANSLVHTAETTSRKSAPYLDVPGYLSRLEESDDYCCVRYFGLASDDYKNVYAAGDVGQALRRGPSTVNAWRGIWEESPPLDLRAVAPVAKNDAFAVSKNGTLARWNGSAWSPISVAGSDGENIWFGAIAGSSPTNVWALGGGNVVAHYDGAGWNSFPPMEAIDAIWTSAWAHTEDEVWIVGTAELGGPTPGHFFIGLRGDERGFSEQFREPILVDEAAKLNPRGLAPSIFGRSSSLLWIALPTADRRGARFFRSDGERFESIPGLFPKHGYYEDRPEYWSPPLIWGSRADYLWSGPPLYRFDGTDWHEQVGAPLGTFVTGLSGTTADDVWAIGVRTPDSAIVRWNGNTLSTELTVPGALEAINRGPDDQLWIVGSDGITLTLAPPNSIVR